MRMRKWTGPLSIESSWNSWLTQRKIGMARGKSDGLLWSPSTSLIHRTLWRVTISTASIRQSQCDAVPRAGTNEGICQTLLTCPHSHMSGFTTLPPVSSASQAICTSNLLNSGLSNLSWRDGKICPNQCASESEAFVDLQIFGLLLQVSIAPTTGCNLINEEGRDQQRFET